MAQLELPSDFGTSQDYSEVERIPTSSSEDEGILYKGKRGSHWITIRQHLNDEDEYSFKLCEEHRSVYILTSLESFHRQEGHFFVYETHTSLAEWIKDARNVVQKEQFNPQFIQILRDLFCGLQYLHSIGKNHGRICTSSIAVIQDANANRVRGKLMNFCLWEDIQSDCCSAASMLQHHIVDKYDPPKGKNIVDGWKVTKTNKMEMSSFLDFLLFCGQTNEVYLKTALSSIHNYPLFLNMTMRAMVRVQCMIHYRYAEFFVRHKVLSYIPLEKDGAEWQKCITNPYLQTLCYNEQYVDPIKQFKGYTNTGFDFMKYGRNVIVHIHEKYTGMSLKEVEFGLEQVWPGFLAIIFNAFHFANLQLLDDS